MSLDCIKTIAFETATKCLTRIVKNPDSDVDSLAEECTRSLPKAITYLEKKAVLIGVQASNMAASELFRHTKLSVIKENAANFFISLHQKLALIFDAELFRSDMSKQIKALCSLPKIQKNRTWAIFAAAVMAASLTMTGISEAAITQGDKNITIEEANHRDFYLPLTNMPIVNEILLREKFAAFPVPVKLGIIAAQFLQKQLDSKLTPEQLENINDSISSGLGEKYEKNDTKLQLKFANAEENSIKEKIISEYAANHKLSYENILTFISHLQHDEHLNPELKEKIATLFLHSEKNSNFSINR